jgi:NADH:ubiquinone oxidoreductase subunit 5 (subunit L)/multisubunit Na+/H+ antiporter MnhA subunit
MGKESEHLKKQEHVHEAPKIMLIPAMILTGCCIVWGLSQPLVASFLHVPSEGLLAAFTNIEFPIFVALLIPTGLIAYYTYYKGFQGVRNIAGTKNPLSTTLKHAFFFDDFYRLVSKGFNSLSNGLTRVENSLFSRIPDNAGTKVGETAEPQNAKTLKKGPSDSFRNYVAAAVLGFILIIVLIILTVGV